MTGSYTITSRDNEQHCRESSRRVLPLPPDVRNVILMQQNLSAMLPDWLKEDQPSNKEQFAVPVQSNVQQINKMVSSGNTTLIGDYIAASFPVHDKKWLIQASGNATIGFIIQAIKEDNITVDRRYIFITVGHNQVRSITRGEINNYFTQLIQVIRKKNAQCKIFVTMLLPRLVDNDEMKPVIIKFNRVLSQIMGKINWNDHRVLLLAVQHSFIKDAVPIQHYYNQDRYTPSKAGASTLKKPMFELAGFKPSV